MRIQGRYKPENSAGLNLASSPSFPTWICDWEEAVWVRCPPCQCLLKKLTRAQKSFDWHSFVRPLIGFTHTLPPSDTSALCSDNSWVRPACTCVSLLSDTLQNRALSTGEKETFGPSHDMTTASNPKSCQWFTNWDCLSRWCWLVFLESPRQQRGAFFLFFALSAGNKDPLWRLNNSSTFVPQMLLEFERSSSRWTTSPRKWQARRSYSWKWDCRKKRPSPCSVVIKSRVRWFEFISIPLLSPLALTGVVGSALPSGCTELTSFPGLPIPSWEQYSFP